MIEARNPHSPTPNATPDLTRDARARAWAFVYDCHVKKNAAGVDITNGDDAKGSENDRDRSKYTG